MDATADLSVIEALALLPEPERNQIIDGLGPERAAHLVNDWQSWARPKQLPPPGDWLVWMLRAGRGFGKTRTGAGWTHERATTERRWIAYIAKTPADARDYMVEGPGGVLRNTPKADRPTYEPSKRRLTWPNGSWATVYSSEEPDQLRGFSGDTAWIDEFAKFGNPREVWDNLQMGMREASTDRPRILVTTTPRALPLLEEIESKPTTTTVIGSSYENRSNLSPFWFDDILSRYEGTDLGRQEIYADILDLVEGRVYTSFSRKPFPEGNIDESVKDIGGELLVGQDFNVNPMASVLGCKVGDELHIFDALEIPVSNTEEVAAEIRRRYPNRQVTVCPDPAGNARHSSSRAGVTDFTILRGAGFTVRAPRQAPAVVDRIANVQAMLFQGTRRKLRIHPRAAPLITALYGLCYKEGTRQPDKGSGFDHITDALGYLCWQEFNVLAPRTATVSTVTL